MTEKNWHKFPLLFSLYLAQSIPMSFFTTVLPIIMRQENYSLVSIGLLQLVKIPWILKFLWAPLVDNRARSTQQLRKWIFASEIFYALVIFGIAFLQLETNFVLIVVLLVVAFVAAGTQDIAVDIFAILTLRKAERSLGNSMQSGGSFVGSLIGTGFLLVAYHYFGWFNVLVLLAALVLLALLPLYFSRVKLLTENTQKPRVRMADLLTFFKQKNQWQHLLLLVFYYSGLIGIMAMLKPWLVDLGYDMNEIAFMSGIMGTSAAALATFAAGFIMRRTGVRIALYLFWSLAFVATVYFFVISKTTPSIHLLYVGIALVWVAYGMATVGIFTLAMNKVRKGREGTDFTLQIVLTHIGSLLVASASGFVANAWGYNALFATGVVFNVLVLIILVVNQMKNRELNAELVLSGKKNMND